MKIGIAIEETWSFLHEIYADLEAHHEVELFERRQFSLPVFNMRINNQIFQRDLQGFLQRNDVVFFEWSSDLLAAATQLPKTCGIVTRLHRYELYLTADRINWANVDQIILVTEAKRQEFLARFPAQHEKIVVIPEAVSLDKFQPHPRTFNGDLGIICHLRPRKRVYELVLSFYQLTQVRPDLHLHIGGGMASGFGEYYDAVHGLVTRLDLDSKVTFYEHVDEPQNWYHDIDVLISNSYSEGLQVTLLEAMASGCHVYSHAWSGVDELLPPEYLFETGAELNAKLLMLMDMPESERAQQRELLHSLVSDKCDISKTKAQIRHLIETVGDQSGAKVAQSA